MLIGREAELKQLEQYYEREGSQIVVLYGQKNIGKTSLVKEFAKDKANVYYMSRSCSEREQLFRWSAELVGKGYSVSEYPSYMEIVTEIVGANENKVVLVVDEFQYIVKTGSTFMDELVSFVRQNQEKRIFVVLCSSSVGWVENTMLEKLGRNAYVLSGLMKLKELKFYDLMEFFPYYSMEQCVECYSILGGVPGLWMHFGDKMTIQDNVIRNILPPTGNLMNEALEIMSEELRETAVYNTILASIAGGKTKLNDLYLHTGFSRAKISVYLKNLMELEVVEKVFSFETEGREQTQKGIYRIKNHLLYFYFRFIYPSLSDLNNLDRVSFYQSCIGPGLKAYASEFFKDVCLEILEERNREGQLAFEYKKSGEWVGKNGLIDIVAQDNEGNTLVAKCCYDKAMFTYDEYEKLIENMKMAKVQDAHIYLFSIGRFDERVSLEAKVKKKLHLFAINVR